MGQAQSRRAGLASNIGHALAASSTPTSGSGSSPAALNDITNTRTEPVLVGTNATPQESSRILASDVSTSEQISSPKSESSSRSTPSSSMRKRLSRILHTRRSSTSASMASKAPPGPALSASTRTVDSSLSADPLPTFDTSPQAESQPSGTHAKPITNAIENISNDLQESLNVISDEMGNPSSEVESMRPRPLDVASSSRTTLSSPTIVATSPLGFHKEESAAANSPPLLDDALIDIVARHDFNIPSNPRDEDHTLVSVPMTFSKSEKGGDKNLDGFGGSDAEPIVIAPQPLPISASPTIIMEPHIELDHTLENRVNESVVPLSSAPGTSLLSSSTSAPSSVKGEYLKSSIEGGEKDQPPADLNHNISMLETSDGVDLGSTSKTSSLATSPLMLAPIKEEQNERLTEIKKPEGDSLSPAESHSSLPPSPIEPDSDSASSPSSTYASLPPLSPILNRRSQLPPDHAQESSIVPETSAAPIPEATSTSPAAAPLVDEPHAIASGTAMIIQGVIQTLGLGSVLRGDESGPPPSSSTSNGLRTSPSSNSIASSLRSGGGSASRRRSLFGGSRSVEPIVRAESNSRERSNVWETTPLASEARESGPSRSTPRAESTNDRFNSPLQDNATRETGEGAEHPIPQSGNPGSDILEGVDVLTMLLSFVTAAAGRSLMNGSNSPDLSMVSALVNRANDAGSRDRDFRPPSTSRETRGSPNPLTSGSGRDSPFESNSRRRDSAPVLAPVSTSPFPTPTASVSAPSHPAPTNTNRHSLLDSVRQRLFRSTTGTSDVSDVQQELTRHYTPTSDPVSDALAPSPDSSTIADHMPDSSPTNTSPSRSSTITPSRILPRIRTPVAPQDQVARPAPVAVNGQFTVSSAVPVSQTQGQTGLSREERQQIERTMGVLVSNLTRQLASLADERETSPHVEGGASALDESQLERTRGDETPRGGDEASSHLNDLIPPEPAQIDPYTVPLPPDEPGDFVDEPSDEVEAVSDRLRTVEALLAQLARVRTLLDSISESLPSAGASPTSPMSTNSLIPSSPPPPFPYQSPPRPMGSLPSSPLASRTPGFPFQPSLAPTIDESSMGSVMGISGVTQMSFGNFLGDIQRDLRQTLQTRITADVERARRERASPPSPATSGNDSTPRRAGVNEESIQGRHLEHHIPSVDLPLNWWRLFRFPPRESLVPSPPSSPERPNASGIPDHEEPGENVSSDTSAHSTSPPATRTLTPVLIVGLRQHRAPNGPPPTRADDYLDDFEMGIIDEEFRESEAQGHPHHGPDGPSEWNLEEQRRLVAEYSREQEAQSRNARPNSDFAASSERQSEEITRHAASAQEVRTRASAVRTARAENNSVSSSEEMPDLIPLSSLRHPEADAAEVGITTSNATALDNASSHTVTQHRAERESWREQMRDYFSSVFNNSNADNSSTPGASTSSAREPRTASSSNPDPGPGRRRLRDRIANIRRGISNRNRQDSPGRERSSAGEEGGPGHSYVIWVIGGYYPEEMVNTIVPHFMLGQSDHDDFWALAELLGQVKPPVASHDDIEKSGLETIKTSQLKDYVKGKKITENTADNCLICLSDYEEDEDLRILNCRHAFHKDCVDTWMATGRNNCPACRSKGVETESDNPPEELPSTSS